MSVFRILSMTAASTSIKKKHLSQDAVQIVMMFVHQLLWHVIINSAS